MNDRTGHIVAGMVLLAGLLMPLALQAQGGYAGSILRMGIGSRSEAMGRAYTAFIGDPESAYYNPATIPFLEARIIDISVRALPLDRTFAYFGFATRLRPKSKYAPTHTEDYQYGGLSLSWIHASVNNIEGRDFDGVKFGEYSNQQNALRFSFALRLRKELAIGIGAHIIWNRFPRLGKGGETVSSNSASLDIGVLVMPVEGLWLGVTLRHLNGKYSWDSNKLYERGTQKIDRFPKIWRVGVSTSRVLQNLWLSFDLEGSEVFAVKTYAGAYYQLPANLGLRVGLRGGQPTFGASYTFSFLSKQAALHYAFVNQANELNADHIFSWSFRF
ncbi:MAG: hypothetical protein Q9P90_07750 [candidate division KSB1 bacterium]|nr:hypothetical protein [candidate division KSB1 bacterium]